jgi:pimeloyl-ACP methyl ester carboxylesterase
MQSNFEETERIQLSDGRSLAYVEYGDREGIPVMFFHGTPGSRLFHHPNGSIASRLGARIIAIDRPGFGRSDPDPDRTLTDWPADVTAVADRLGIEEFAVAGFSGGGPYVAACAAGIPDRVSAATIVGGLGPVETPNGTAGMGLPLRLMLVIARRAPWLLRPFLWLAGPGRDPEGTVEQEAEQAPDPDRAVLERPEVRSILVADFAEATYTSTRGMARDAKLFARPWGFDLGTITTRIHLWHGAEDGNVPIQMGRYMAEQLPNCRPKFLLDEAHYSLFFNHWREILAVLLADT